MIHSNITYRGLAKDGSIFDYRYPRNPRELVDLLNRHNDTTKIALLVLTPFEEPRDGSSGPARQYFTGWALSHLRTLYRQYGAKLFVEHLRMVHEYLCQGGQVRNPIGLFTYRLRHEPIAIDGNQGGVK